MTNEEAKVFMLQFNTDKRLNSSEHEAVRMAIKALEQEPILDKIKAEITDWQNDIHDNENDADEHDFVFERIFEIFDEYTSESDGKENEN